MRTLLLGAALALSFGQAGAAIKAGWDLATNKAL